MIPGASLFLYLLPLAAAPIVFHLLMRRQRRRIMFSTKMFFDRVHPQLTFHRKVRDMLLLAARVLLIALLLLALSRLVVTGITGVSGLGGKQVVVVILDNSASMAGLVKGSEQTKLKTAVAGARALLATMDQGAKSGVVPLVADPEVEQWGGITADRNLQLNSLDKVRVTAAAGDPAKALMQAVAMLKDAGSAGGGSVHIFTDLQETEWKDRQIHTKDVGPNVRILFHRVTSAAADQPNVCLAQAKISSRRILQRQPYQVELLLRNDGDKAVEIRVNMQIQNQTAPDTTKVAMAAGEKKRVMMGFRAEAPGAHWLRVWIEGDGFQEDNRAALSYLCEPTGDICFIGGQEAGDFGVLPLAFSPAGDGRDTSLVPGFGGLQDLGARIESKKPVLVVLKWSDACALDGKTADLLETYTRQGGNLLVLPAVAGPEPTGKPPAWLGAGVEALKVLPTAVSLAVADGTSEFWSDLRDPVGRIRLSGVYAKQYHPLSLQQEGGYTPLLKADENQVLLAVRGLGEGQVIVSGLAFAGRREGIPEWSTLPMQRAFLVMVQPMALGAVSGVVNRNLSLVAGNAPRSLPGKEDEVKISTLVGDQVLWAGPRAQAPVLVREGAYIVRMGKRELCLSVMPSDTEGSGSFITGSKVDAMGETPHAIGDLTSEQDFRDTLARSGAGMELYIPLLLLAIVALLAEGLLGSPVLRRAKGPDDGNKPDGLGGSKADSTTKFSREETV
jgi:hypothetical protein